MKETDTLIVGAGPSGLSLAYHLDRDSLILEKEAEVGGLCRTIEKDGGVFDIGGHSFHTPHPEVRRLVKRLMGDNWHAQKRDARVYFRGEAIPYPFQKNFELLPFPDVVEECKEGLRRAGDAGKARHFGEYLTRRFGRGVAEHFMLPYNRKIWARSLDKISCEWTSERVAAPKGKSEKFDTKGGKRKPLQSDTEVGYPLEGGYAEIFKSFVPHVPAIELEQEVVRIDPERKVAWTARGDSFGWNVLVSTMPLPELMRLLDGATPDLVATTDRLEYMSLNLLLLLIGAPLSDAPHRLYIADPDIPPHKIAFNHTSSPVLAQRPVHAVMAEISYSDEKPLPPSEELEHDTVRFLVSQGILENREQVRWMDHVNVKYAYPVYTHEREAILGRVKERLHSWDIFTLGRFGEWEYINSDKCIMKGMRLAETLAATASVP